MNLEQESKRLQQRLNELSSWRVREVSPLEEAWFKAQDMPARVSIEPGQMWPSCAFPVHMGFTARVPVNWSKRPVWVNLSIGGEGILMIGKRAMGGLDPYHKEIQLFQAARGGEKIVLEVEAVPRGPFGVPQREPKLKTATLFSVDPDVLPLCEDIAAVLEAAGYVEPDLAVLLLETVGKVFASLSLPRSPSNAYLARLIQAPSGADMMAELWEEWDFTEAPLPLPESLRPDIQQARAHLRERLEVIRHQYPPRGKLYLNGHAHLDLAWLWPLAETRRKARRTFASVLSLMEQYPELSFNQSMSQIYAYIEKDDPELFSRVKTRVTEGRWEPIGGMWVEPDGNLLAGESWARQLLYGQEYFESRFEKRARVAWLPDSFGFAANLPQILRQAGLDYFFTHKLTWNETNEFPYHLYWWEGIDGTRLLTHIFHNPGGYNSTLSANDLQGTWKNYKGKDHHPESLLTFGWGDGGGGPTRDMLERYQRFQDFPGLPKLRVGRVETFFQEIVEKIHQGGTEKRAASDLPVWVGEKYLEFHRATYTTQARIKALNRRLEHALPEAEAASSLAWITGAGYQKSELEQAWKVLLRNQFHDILPGSSIRTVVEEAEREMSAALEKAEKIRDQALETLSRPTTGQPNAAARVVVWNLSLDTRPLRVSFPQIIDPPFHILSPDGFEIPHQIAAEGQVLAAHETQVPGLGYLTLSLIPGRGTKTVPLRASDSLLENQHLCADIAPDGTLASLFDKDFHREILDDRGNQVWVYTDLPREWDAWDVDASYVREGLEITAESPPELVESGPVRAGVRVIRRVGESTIEQVYRLWAGSRRLEIENRVQWDERRTLLRARFPLKIRTHEAWFETAFGTIPRPTHRNTSYEQARFEVPALRFADMSEAGYGISLLNDCKYGYSAMGNEIGISLLRGSIYPDPYADRGEHLFVYALYGHPGDWRQGVPSQAHDLNAPLRAVVLPGKGSHNPSVRQYMSVEAPNLRLSCLKRAESGEGIILRLYEAHGARGQSTLDVSALGIGLDSAQTTNLLEDHLGYMDLEKGQTSLDFRPYQVISVLLSTRPAQASPTRTKL